MRIIVFFDLPTITADDRREYRKFRKKLIKHGFFMMQESVYCRMAFNKTAVNSVMANLRILKPKNGLVQALIITEKQFEKMEIISGEFHTDVIDSDERVVFL